MKKIKTATTEHKHKASMAKMIPACIVTAGYGITSWTSSSIDCESDSALSGKTSKIGQEYT